MIAAAVAMLRGRWDVSDESSGPLPIAKILVQGAAVGLISGLVGAGFSFGARPGSARWPADAGGVWDLAGGDLHAVLRGLLATWPVNRLTGNWPEWSPRPPSSAALSAVC